MQKVIKNSLYCIIKHELVSYVTSNIDTLLGKTLHVKCNGVSMDSNGVYSVLHPRVGEHLFRNDKDVADSLDYIKRIEAMVKGLKNI